jgi:hypothetical protein
MESPNHLKSLIAIIILFMLSNMVYAQKERFPPDLYEGIKNIETNSIRFSETFLDSDNIDKNLAFKWLGQYRGKSYHFENDMIKERLYILSVMYYHQNTVSIVIEIFDVQPDGSITLKNKGEIYPVELNSDKNIVASTSINHARLFIVKDEYLKNTIRVYVQIGNPTGGSFNNYSFAAKLE